MQDKEDRFFLNLQINPKNIMVILSLAFGVILVSF